MGRVNRRIGYAFVALLTLLSIVVVVPPAGAQAGDIGDQWNQVGDVVDLAVSFEVGTDVVGLPAGLVYANDAITGTTATKGRWPVEIREPSGTTYIEWVVTDGPPPGIVAEHLPVNPENVSPRPAEGMDGVVWNRFHNDTTSSLDVTVWDLQQVGPYMYVGGEFEEVIEQGPDGSDGAEHDQAHLARFSVDTGEWDPTFRPVLDGNVHALELSPRGLLLVGGEFTNINGLPATEGLAAFDPATGLIDPTFEAWVERPWYPQGKALVRELEVVGDYLYIGGNFSHINGPGGTRVRVHKAARVGADYGTIDPTWMPEVSGGSVWGIGVDQTRGRVHLSGWFHSINGDTTLDRFGTVDTEIGANVPGLLPRETNVSNPNKIEVYDAEYFNDSVWIAGSQHYVARFASSNLALQSWNLTGIACTNWFWCGGAGVGGDFQFVEKIGNYAFSGCHCNEPYDSSGRPNHYSSVTDQRTTHRVAIAYDATGAPVDTEFDIGGNIDGAWAVATDDLGCIWFGGDIIDGGFYEPGGRVFARGFARFCGDEMVPPAPQGLNAPVVEIDQISLEWDAVTAVPPAVAYRISRDGVEVASVDTPDTTWTDDTVSPGTTYLYEVRTENRAGILSDPSAITVTSGEPDTEPPTIPQNLTAVDAGNDTVQLGWDASTDNVAVASYLVYRNNAFLAWTPGDTTTFLDTTTVTGTTYTYEVRAADASDNQSEKSDPASITLGGPDTEAPTIPQNVTAIDAGNDTVQVTWDASTDNIGIASYLVYRNGAYLAWTPDGTTTFLDTTTVTGTTYTYEIRATDPSDNRSAKSDPASITLGGPDSEAPSIPQNLTAADAGNDTVQIAWDASTDNIGIASYLIYRNGAYLAWTPDGTTTFLDTTTVTGTTYTYEIRATDPSTNQSEKSDPASITLGGPDTEAPSIPQNLTAADAGNDTVQIAWDASTDNIGIASYLIYRNGAYLAWTPDGTTTFLDTTTVTGTTYTYEVRATDPSDNRSDRSDPASITLGGPDTEAPTIPQNLAAIDAGNATAQLSWDASTDNIAVASYLIYRDGAYLAWTPGDTTTFLDLTTVAGTTYTYEVRATDPSDNRSDKSDPVSIILR